jgi:dihydrolipoamide dehydrogenase
MTSGLLPGADRDLVSFLAKRIEKSFDKIMLDSKVVEMKESGDLITVKIQSQDGKISDYMYEYVLMSVGRRPETKGLGLENTKVKVNQKGWVEVNKQLQTNDPSIYAIGDIAGEPMLAHKASHEGRTAVEHIAGHKVAFEPLAIPAVVFTDPEIAWAGLTETKAREQNINYVSAKFPWAASGRATTLGRSDGVTKLLIDPESERILGVGICGPGAGELIAEGVLAIEMGANASDLKLTIHPHPTLSETIMEAAEVFFGQSTHIYRPKK